MAILARSRWSDADSQDGEPALSWSRTVLLLTREPAKGGALIGALQERGLPAILATTARWALAWTRHALPPLIVVDLGVHQARLLLAQFRREGRALIALSNDPQERTWALELGCMEAYPSLEPREFALKIAALMQDRKPRRVGKVSAGSLLVDLSERRIVWRGKEIAAPRQMLELAAYLARHAGEFVPARVLLLEVWGEPWADPNRVHQAFWRLRRYLNEPVASPYLICLRGGHGYGYFPSGLSVNRSRASKM